MAHTLYASGVYMGSKLNAYGELVRDEHFSLKIWRRRDTMRDACRILARHVEWKGGLEWDFSKLHAMPIPEKFQKLIRWYLKPVLNHESAARGWKLPETTLVYPWIVRMFPEIKYIYWIRNPRDCVLAGPVYDLAEFGIPYSKTEDITLRRAISWKYQWDIVKATPRPANWIAVRFEDFVLRQNETLARLEEFLGMDLARIIVRRDAVDRWKHAKGVNYFDFFAPAMAEYGYAAPPTEKI
jgi:hypothetical protein